ncbi:MAG TPA: hypothetical protein VEO01_38710 [Pseudonocardiaceae bacterium]|nr:hypothetical protein [Pseudonocardiaceae bacterium]
MGVDVSRRQGQAPPEVGAALPPDPDEIKITDEGIIPVFKIPGPDIALTSIRGKQFEVRRHCGVGRCGPKSAGQRRLRFRGGLDLI